MHIMLHFFNVWVHTYYVTRFLSRPVPGKPTLYYGCMSARAGVSTRAGCGFPRFLLVRYCQWYKTFELSRRQVHMHSIVSYVCALTNCTVRYVTFAHARFCIACTCVKNMPIVEKRKALYDTDSIEKWPGQLM